MKNQNIASVSVSVNSNGTGLKTVINRGIVLDASQKEARGFSMKTRSRVVRWKDGKSLGTVENNLLVDGGFYLQKKPYSLREDEYPFFLNIGTRFQQGYENDIEIFLKISPRCSLNLFSVDSSSVDILTECVNFPKSPKEFVGELLLRIPDGCFLRIETKFGIACILNTKGCLTKYIGMFPNPNTREKATKAAFARKIWADISSSEMMFLKAKEHSLENAFAQ